jgi:hypothetical protein
MTLSAEYVCYLFSALSRFFRFSFPSLRIARQLDLPSNADTMASTVDKDVTSAVTQEHAFHACDALYCALTGAEPIDPKFPDDK